MSWLKIAVVIGGIAFVVQLLRASSAINRNPYQRLKIHEDVGVKFPSGMPFHERHRLLDWRGLSPRSWVRFAVVLLLFLLAVFAMR
jgi:hypothetical protein